MLRGLAGLAIGGAAAPALSACGAGGSKSKAKGAISISSWSGTNSTAKPDLAAQQATLDLFKKKYPKIDIRLTTSTGGGDTLQLLPAKLAGGQLETHYAVPLASAYIPVDQHQAADITDILRGWKYYSELNPSGIAGTSIGGKHYGFVDYTNVHGLLYSRRLFKKAGLDPDQPPTTWDEFREAAKAVTGLGNGVYGFAIEGGLIGGWRHVEWLYTTGARVEKRDASGKWICDLTTTQGSATAHLWHDMRFSDKTMSPKLYKYGDLFQDLVLGKIGMMIGQIHDIAGLVGPKSQFGVPVEDIGFAMTPQNGGNATYMNSTAELFNPKADAEALQAAFTYESFIHMDPSAIDAKLKAYVAAGGSVNPLDTSAQALKAGSSLRAEIDAVVKKHASMPDDITRPFVDGLAKVQLVDEPPVQSQEVYQLLGTTTESLLTDSNTDVDEAMSKVAATITSKLLSKAK